MTAPPSAEPPASASPPRWSGFSDTHRFLLLSVLIGVFAGLLVVCFHTAIELVSWRALGVPVGESPSSTLLAPALGALFATGVVSVFRSAQGSGVNHTKLAIYVSDGRVPFGAVVGKFLACSASIGAGNPLGPEDPALQMGAGIASQLGRLFRVTREHMRLIAPVGAAAGIAAAFNTPITAVLFVIEEVIAGWSAGVLGSIVLSAVSAVVVSRAFLGDEPLFRVPAFSLTDSSELWLYAGLGLLGGLLGAAYATGMMKLRARVRRFPARVRYALPLGVGLVVGGVGLLLPEVLGAGYPTVDSALHDEFGWQRLLALGLVKTGLTLLCFSAGTPGGLFAPTLFIGAMLGGSVGALAQTYWPTPTSPPSAYVLAGMGVLFAAVFRTPMTSIFMVFEVSATYVIILPVMIANTLAYLVSRGLQPAGLFDVVGRQDGAHLPSLDMQREQKLLTVEDAMAAAGAVPVLPADMPAVEGRQRAEESAAALVLVARPRRGWTPLTRGALDEAARDNGSGTLADAVGDPAPTVFPDEPIDTALRLLGAHAALPVVSRTDPSRLVGLVTLAGVLRRYGVQGPTTSPPPAPAPAAPPDTETLPAAPP